MQRGPLPHRTQKGAAPAPPTRRSRSHHPDPARSFLSKGPQIGLPPPDFPFLPHIALGRFNQAFTELEIQRLYDAVEEPIR